MFHVKHSEDVMTVERAADILTHRKDHWSHEIADAEQIAQDVLIKIATGEGYCFEDARLILNSYLIGREHDKQRSKVVD